MGNESIIMFEIFCSETIFLAMQHTGFRPKFSVKHDFFGM